MRVTIGGLLMYENSPSLQRLLKRLEKECGLVLPVDRANYSLYLSRAAQRDWDIGIWQWVALVPEQPRFGTLGSEHSVTRLLRCKVLETIQQNNAIEDDLRIEVIGGDRE